MLNLIGMLTANPAPPKGARVVKGSAMSGSQDSVKVAPTAIDRKLMSERAAKAELTVQQLYRAAMLGRGWLSTQQVGTLVGDTERNARHKLNKLEALGLVEQKETLRENLRRGKFMWRWM